MSSFAEWMGAEELRGAPMGLYDPSLDDRSAALTRRSDELLTESERLDKALARANDVIAQARGVGEAESGAVKITVDASNKVVDISLAQRALQLGSTSRLRRALLDAYEAAAADVAEQVSEATGPVDAEPLAAFFEGMPEITSLLPPSVVDTRRSPVPPHQEENND